MKPFTLGLAQVIASSTELAAPGAKAPSPLSALPAHWAERCNPFGIGSRLGCRMSKLQRDAGDLPYAGRSETWPTTCQNVNCCSGGASSEVAICQEVNGLNDMDELTWRSCFARCGWVKCIREGKNPRVWLVLKRVWSFFRGIAIIFEIPVAFWNNFAMLLAPLNPKRARTA